MPTADLNSVREDMPQRSRPRMRQASERVEALARELGAGARLPTFQELRYELGVSPSTLNVALKDLEERGVVRRVHGTGLFVAPRLQRHIAVICHANVFHRPEHSPFWSMLVKRVRTCALDERLSFHLAVPAQDDVFASTEVSASAREKGVGLEASLREAIARGNVHGVVAIGLKEKTVGWIMEHGIPVVGFASASTPHSVVLDKQHFAEQGVHELARRGCRRIALWTPQIGGDLPGSLAQHHAEQLRAFQHALAEHDLVFYPRLLRGVWQLAEQVAPGAENAAHNEASETIYPPFGEQGYRAALGTWRLPRNEWPDGILVTDDLMMQGALGGMRECGVEVGRDVKVVSHANVGSPTLLGYEKDLTLLEVNPSEIVEVLFSTLDKAMNGGQAPTLIRLQAHFRSPT